MSLQKYRYCVFDQRKCLGRSVSRDSSCLAIIVTPTHIIRLCPRFGKRDAGRAISLPCASPRADGGHERREVQCPEGTGAVRRAGDLTDGKKDGEAPTGDLVFGYIVEGAR